MEDKNKKEKAENNHGVRLGERKIKGKRQEE